jgi:formylglycine-generating enzyme required for sulfatase activity
VPADPATFVAKVPVRPAVKPPAEAPRSGPRARPRQVVDLGGGAAIEFTYVPAGSFPMGGSLPDESPAHTVRIGRGYWLASTEVTNAQFARFDPAHDSGREHLRGYAFGMEGYPLNQPAQPVVRVSWHRANEFCAWLAQRTGLKVTLPTEAQWEYACRAGTATPFHYGQLGANFPLYANFADLKTREFAADSYLRTVPTPLSLPGFADDYLPKDERFHDGALVASPVGGRLPNAWGFFDLHGNVSEWTRSVYQSYPYRDDDGRNDLQAPGRRVVRGGSWRDRPFRGAAGFRQALPAHAARVEVGFRVMVDEDRIEFPGAATLAVR